MRPEVRVLTMKPRLSGCVKGGTRGQAVTKAQSGSLLIVTHDSPTFPRIRSVPQVGQREEMTAQSPPGVPSAPIGQQQTPLFWFLRLNNASHPRPLRGVALSNRN